MTEAIRVMLVDDHPIVRDGLRTMLKAQERMDVIGEAPDGAQAIKMASRLQPDVVVMDIGLPDINGLEATRLLRQDCSATRILILTVYENPEYALRAARLGASGYLVKNVSSQDLGDAITRIHMGETVFAPTLKSLIDAEQVDSSPVEDPQKLSRRQREVLTLIAEGLSSQVIAALLSLSQRTVETHRRHICHRLQIRTVAGLTKYAIAAGLTRLD